MLIFFKKTTICCDMCDFKKTWWDIATRSKFSVPPFVVGFTHMHRLCIRLLWSEFDRYDPLLGQTQSHISAHVCDHASPT